MPRNGIFLWGARSQARIVAAFLTRAGKPPTHLFDATLEKAQFSGPARFANTPEGLASALRDCAEFVVCMGGAHGAQRAAVSAALRDRFGMAPLSVISPHAVIDPEAVLADGVQIMPGVYVMPGARIGAFTLLNTACVVDHECDVGAGVHVMGSAAIAGRVRIGDHVSVGTNATIMPDTVIGAGAQIGAGSVVRADVDDNAVVVGVPCRVIRYQAPVVDIGLLDQITP